MTIDGRQIANEIISELKKQPKPNKFLAVFLVGDDASSISFIKQKEKVARELSVDFRLYKFPEDIKQDFLRKEVLKIASHKTCGGVIVQLPLPTHLNAQYILNAIPKEKDIDVLGERALGAFYADRNPILPPAVGAAISILERVFGAEERAVLSGLAAKRVVVIGRGSLIGKPIAKWFMDKVAELSVFASHTKDLKSKLKDADIIISGVGKANLFGSEDLKESAVVIDFGYSVVKATSDKRQGISRVVGDFDTSTLLMSHVALSYTPTPGGTGPVLVAKLFENFYTLDKIR